MSTRGSLWAFPGKVWYPAGRVPLGIVASGPAEALRGDGGWRVSDSPAALTASLRTDSPVRILNAQPGSPVSSAQVLDRG
jgi:hypothetical protein